MSPGAPAGLKTPGLTKCTVETSILGTSIRTLVDTGAEGGGISSTVVDADPRLRKYIHRRKPKTCISVNKSPLQSPFSLLLPIKIASAIYHYEVNVIRNLVNPLLLGLDFLTKYGAMLDFASNRLILGNEGVSIGTANFLPTAPTHVALVEEVVLDPESFNLVKVRVEGPDPCVGENPPKLMTIRPLMGDREEELPVLAAWGVLDLSREIHTIEILNPTKEAVTLPIGTPVAVQENLDPEILNETTDPTTMATTCDDPIEVTKDGGGDGSSSTPSMEPPLCEHPKDDDNDDEPELDGARFSISTKGSVLDREQKQEFAELCEEYSNVFAKHEHDLGTTQLMHHYIELTTEKPIHAPQYRTPPPEVRQEIDRETDELLAMGVARESNSPYSAPIVLVKKKLGGVQILHGF